MVSGAILETINLPEEGLLSKMSEAYFRPKSFEKSGRLYKALGVEHFRKLFSDKHNVGEYLPDRKQKTIRDFYEFTKEKELFHLCGVAVTVPLTYYLFKNDMVGASSIFSFYSLWGMYQVVLQRFNRNRFVNYFKKLTSRQEQRSQEASGRLQELASQQ